MPPGGSPFARLTKEPVQRRRQLCRQNALCKESLSTVVYDSSRKQTSWVNQSILSGFTQWVLAARNAGTGRAVNLVVKDETVVEFTCI